jgi:hypothetical protein
MNTVYIYTHTHAYIHMYTHTHTYMLTYIHTQVRSYVQYIRTYMHECLDIYIYIYIFIFINARAYVYCFTILVTWFVMLWGIEVCLSAP